MSTEEYPGNIPTCTTSDPIFIIFLCSIFILSLSRSTIAPVGWKGSNDPAFWSALLLGVGVIIVLGIMLMFIGYYLFLWWILVLFAVGPLIPLIILVVANDTRNSLQAVLQQIPTVPPTYVRIWEWMMFQIPFVVLFASAKFGSHVIGGGSWFTSPGKGALIGVSVGLIGFAAVALYQLKDFSTQVIMLTNNNVPIQNSYNDGNNGNSGGIGNFGQGAYIPIENQQSSRNRVRFRDSSPQSEQSRQFRGSSSTHHTSVQKQPSIISQSQPRSQPQSQSRPQSRSSTLPRSSLSMSTSRQTMSPETRYDTTRPIAIPTVSPTVRPTSSVMYHNDVNRRQHMEYDHRDYNQHRVPLSSLSNDHISNVVRHVGGVVNVVQTAVSAFNDIKDQLNDNNTQYRYQPSQTMLRRHTQSPVHRQSPTVNRRSSSVHIEELDE
jgi:hypothetical protein